MLFFGVFLRESAPTAAKSRTNRSTNSEKATKRLGRLAQNMAHMCKFIWEWIYAKQIAPRDTRGAVWGGGGGGFRGTTIKKSGEAVRLAPTLVHVCGYTPNKLPVETQGALGGFRRQTFKSLGKLSNGCTDWHQLRFMSADSSGSRHRLNTSRPTIPRWHFWGVLGGHKFKCLGKLSNGLTDWHQLLVLLGMDIAKYNSPLNSTRGISRILGGHKLTRYPTAAFKNLGNVVKRLDRLGINFAHIMQVNLEMDTG